MPSAALHSTRPRAACSGRALLATPLLLVALAAPAGASAAGVTVVAKGAGFGHGIGMSQYGAYGQALAGRSAATILATYFKGTSLQKGSSARTIRVLLQSASGARVRGVTSIAGATRPLSAKSTYVLRRSGSKVTLSSAGGKLIATGQGALRVQAPSGGTFRLMGSALNGVTNGLYRGALELDGSNVVNQLSLEDYVRGVVGGESPSSWPAAALQAQAIAARSYAVTTTHGAVFDQYPDTRSQMYRGVAAETASTDAAVAATTSEFVTYKGKPVTTFFFSSSGGQTENIENSFIGATPEPYLTSVADPWDRRSPDFRWQVRYSRASLQAKLGGWVKGTLESIDIIKRGISPRIVRADIVGSHGRTSVTGPALRTRLGLKDTWVQFIFSSGGTSTLPKATPTPSPTPTGPSTGGAALTLGGSAALGSSAALGGSLLSAIVAQPPGYVPVHGRVWPSAGGRVVRLERHSGGRWRTVQRATTDPTGRWTALVPGGSRYRVAALGVPGPVIDAR